MVKNTASAMWETPPLRTCSRRVRRARRRRWLPAVCLGVILVLPAHGAAEETGLFEISGGYTALGSSEIVDGYAAGWVVGGAWNAARWLAFGVDVGRNSQQQDVGLLDVNARFVSVHAGPRFFLPLGRVRPFAHILIGRTDIDLHVRSAFPPESVGNAFEQSFSWQLGGGVDLSVAARFALRVAFEHHRVSASDPLTQHRILTAVVYTFP